MVLSGFVACDVVLVLFIILYLMLEIHLEFNASPVAPHTSILHFIFSLVRLLPDFMQHFTKIMKTFTYGKFIKREIFSHFENIILFLLLFCIFTKFALNSINYHMHTHKITNFREKTMFFAIFLGQWVWDK